MSRKHFTHDFERNAMLHDTDIEGDVVTGSDEVSVRSVVLGLDVSGVGQRKILLG